MESPDSITLDARKGGSRYKNRGIRPYKRYHYRGPSGRKYHGSHPYYNRYRPLFTNRWQTYPWFYYYRGFPPESPFWYLLSIHPYGDAFWNNFDYYPPSDPYWVQWAPPTGLSASVLGKKHSDEVEAEVESEDESESEEEEEEEEEGWETNERTDSTRNVFYYSASESSGITITQKGFEHYYELYPHQREKVPMPRSMNPNAWRVLSAVRDGMSGGDWEEVEDNDVGGELWARIQESTFLLKPAYHMTHKESEERYGVNDMRELLFLMMNSLQRKDQGERVLFEMVHYNHSEEWGLLVNEGGHVLRYKFSKAGNTMQEKLSHSIPTGVTLPKTQLQAWSEMVWNLERNAESTMSKRPAQSGETTMMMSYGGDSPFIVHTEGRLLLLHKSLGGLSHRLYDSFVSTTG